MTITRDLVATHRLSDEHADMIRATLPLVGANIDSITKTFYTRMFGAQPSLLRNLFNRGNQAQGTQQRALAASIATYATHLIDPTLPHPTELLSRIGHKHASLGITADQYDIVHEHLFAAIVEVLGADTVTADVAAAWDAVYWMMAQTLIDLEHALYDAAGVGAGDVYRRARVVERVQDPSGTVLMTVAVDGASVIEHTAAQYVSVGITLPDGARQLRQYSLINAPGENYITFAIKPVAARPGCPAGEVSNWIADHVAVGDLLDVTVPFGDLPTADLGSTSVVLISAGVGITPMIGMLEHLAKAAPETPVQVLHADDDAAAHPLRERQSMLVSKLPNARLDLWYMDPVGTAAAAGFMDLSDISIDESAHVFLCGGSSFVHSVRKQLTAKGVAPDRIHSELFSPNDWLLD
ncbi:globin domain-containing protein [Jongsikchunia kroppenstedtii]|uniref:globin domain-containing protein n=1 Tax=Jongsikchunia kroppenstedtii TaxID=1121721 RepID=UPI00036D93B1|nr:globin domain-containing protein [Jongsikchunia kroppenstedtii]